MASLRQLKNRWYARVRYSNGHKYSEKLIPLRTESKVVARSRITHVNRVEQDIISGMDYSFPWMNEAHELKVNILSLQEAVDDYLKYLKGNSCRDSTVERAGYCLKNLITVLGAGFHIESITTDHIQRHKVYYKGKKADNGVNIDLARIRAFLNWAKDMKGIIKTMPIVKMLRVPQKLPSYLTESDLAKIFKLESLDDHYKNVFQFYWETGCRLREPFNGQIIGEWLVIDSEHSKTGIPREIQLKPHQIAIVLKLHEKVNESKSLPRTVSTRYSNMFKKACKAIDRPDLHFHNLRDTFAVMRYLKTRDLYHVSKDLGHSSVKITEKYAKFRLRRLEQDFPSLAAGYNQKESKNDIGDTHIRDTALVGTIYAEG